MFIHLYINVYICVYVYCDEFPPVFLIFRDMDGVLCVSY